LRVSAESVVADVVNVLVTVVEACGAAVIGVGAITAFVRFVLIAVRTPHTSAPFVPVRLTLGRYLALGLEFQLASDVLRTAVAPSFKDIGQLAAIAAIRTALNYFLSREIADERRQLREAGTPMPGDMAPVGEPTKPPPGKPPDPPRAADPPPTDPPPAGSAMP
jgi:uncharacterized membrane protein